ncbi:DUF2147 domain-containing protein [Sphingomonas koreensis]
MQGKVQRTSRPLRWMAMLVGAMALATPVVAQAGDVALPVTSEWRNPKDSVRIRFSPCGQDRMCGIVTWASEKAKADARRGGTDQLVGTNLFRNFQRVAPGEYKGHVFVPDMNRTFSGHMEIKGDSMIGKGCVLAGLICKQQVWTRIS